jgi:hypothetical protein
MPFAVEQPQAGFDNWLYRFNYVRENFIRDNFVLPCREGAFESVPPCDPHFRIDMHNCNPRFDGPVQVIIV